MATITIYPDKIIRSDNYEDIQGEWIDDENFAQCMGDCIEIDKDVTFGRFMNILRAASELYQVFFNTELGGFPLEAYLDDMDAPVEKDVEPENTSCIIRYVRVYWDCDIWEHKGVNDFSLNTGFDGFGDIDDSDFGKYQGAIAIEFTPLCRLKDFPLRLDTKFNIMIHVSNQRVFRIQETQNDFLARDVVAAVLNEISFCGMPDDRDIKIEDLKETVQDVKDGKVELISWEDVKKELGEEFDGSKESE